MNVNLILNNLDTAIKNRNQNNNVFQNSMKNIVEEGKKSPTKAHIAMQENLRRRNELITFQNQDYLQNTIEAKMKALSDNAKAFLNISDVVDEAKSNLYNSKEVQKLYPKTGKLRKYLGNRLLMDEVTPKRSLFDKLIISCSANNYEKIYPKTFLLRYKLIIDEQIKNGVTTPKLSLFKKLKYKNFIR